MHIFFSLSNIWDTCNTEFCNISKNIITYNIIDYFSI
jgi:hypothetical protein